MERLNEKTFKVAWRLLFDFYSKECYICICLTEWQFTSVTTSAHSALEKIRLPAIGRHYIMFSDVFVLRFHIDIFNLPIFFA